MLRRVLVPLFVVPALIAMLAAPTLAAPPYRESGVYESFDSSAETCTSGPGAECTYTSLSVYSYDPDTIEVCLYTATYPISRGAPSFTEGYGCTIVDDGALTVTDDFSFILAATDIDFFEYSCKARQCTETFEVVTVSAEDSPIGPVSTSSGRGTFTEDNCTYRFSYTQQFAELAGTMTIDGVTMEQWGYGFVSNATSSVRCR
jgi:hypothetical protein